ncbi:hypothetical protein [Parapedobacter sp. 10938]|uniref:hypothetical protein n=1 Tax=Parapedobacter flavus TaxID=3110225 RepID=UPI002DBE20DB|nr:hypothetical protein [Parapedobacter sp. 10938]MEC3878534.1 hypothetical protein [Parapedobacter sp. 10938]
MMKQTFFNAFLTLLVCWFPFALLAQALQVAGNVFKAGAATSTITPPIGTSINGNMKDVLIKHIHDDTHARALVLDDGQTLLAFVVLDLCMVSREVLDKAKQRAHEFTGIPVDHMMMSATHTHSAGTVCGVFQSEPDSAYLEFVASRAADAIVRAYQNREPARIAWAVGSEPTEVYNRRWHMKPGTPLPDPFGGTDQVKMNPGVGNPALLKPAGPVDPEVPTLSLQALDGRPIAVLANYSLHYVGGVEAGTVSADYYGMFASRIGELVGAESSPFHPPFVGMMTNGTSGDINNIHWSGEKREALLPYRKMHSVADKVAAASHLAIRDAPYHSWVPLRAAQTEISLGVRLPASSDIVRAEKVMRNADGPIMNSLEEIYARETLLLKDYPPQVDIILQAFRIGDFAITAIPAEVFVEVGLELKERSPFKPTFNIGLANGYNGYLPTPAQHQLGGYETWRARSSYLEVDASEKILDTLFQLLDTLR